MPTVGGTLTVASAAGPALVARSQSASNTLTYASRISTDTSDRFTISADGTIQWGPGGASSSDVTLYRGAVNQLRTDDMIFQNYSGGAAIADQDGALKMSISGAPAAPFNGMYGVLSTVTAQPQATTWSYLYGMFSQATYAGSGASTLSTMIAMYSRTMISGASPAGTVTQAAALWIDGPQSQASGTPAVTFANQYGIYIGSQATAPAGMTITTSYGLFINNQTGAAGNLWAIYSAGGKSAHAGSITIGALTNPAYTLDVQGTLRATGAAILASTLSVTGQILAADGTAAAPGYSFASSTGTGMYNLLATSEIGLSYSGTSMIRAGKQFANTSIGLLGTALSQNVRIYTLLVSNDTGLNTTQYGMYLSNTWQPTSELAVSSYAFMSRMVASDVNATGALTSIYVGAIFSALVNTQRTPANALGSIYGLQAQVGSVNNAAPASAVGTAIGVFIQPATWYQNVTSHYGLYITGPVVGTPTGGSQAVITTAIGERILNQGTAGGGTSYGLYMDAQSGATTTWAIFSLGGNSTHVGSITVGANAVPSFTLDVQGTLRATGAVTLQSTLAVTSTSTLTGRVQLGTFATQATTPAPLIGAIAAGNGIEFGHSNTAGYRSTIGAELASGRPFIAFSCAHGTTNNTFITQGFQGSVFQGDLAGGFSWNNIPIATAGTDNQVRVQTMTLGASGVLTLPLAGIVHNGNITFSAAGSLVMRNQAAVGTLSLASRLTADTQDRFTLATDGTMAWGPGGSTATDTALNRSAAATLTLTGTLTVTSAINSGGNISITGSAAVIARSMTAAGSLTFVSRIPADTQDRFQITADGTQSWGPGGSTALDTTLARTGVATLTLTARTIISDPASASAGLTLTQSGTGNGLLVNYNSPASAGHAIYIAANNPGAAFAMLQFNQANVAGNGTYYISAQRQGGAVFAVDGNGQIYSLSASISVISGRVFKDNVEPLSGALDLIAALRPRKWKWSNLPQNRDRVGQTGYGLVAEEVETVLPHLVGEWDTNQGVESSGGKMKTLAMGELVPFLLGAIQELTKRLETLESKT